MKELTRAGICLAYVLAALLVAVNSVHAQGLDSLRQVAQSAFDEGRFEEAELSALRGLREAESIDDLAEIPFRVVLGSVYVARNQTGFALAEFRRVIAINPAFDLDPVLTSPKILEVFGQAKREYIEQVLSQPEAYRLPESDAKHQASWRSALLPGWGQQYKQHKVKGAVFSLAQVVTLAAFVAMAIETSNRKDDYLSLHEYDPARLDDRYNSYQSAYRTRNILGYVTLAVYLANYYDALYAPVRSEKKNP
jgi:predicted Zn-dependent protease